jgi:hypothetical protein
MKAPNFSGLILTVAGGFLTDCKADDLKPLEVDYMLRGYCYAGGRADKSAIGGYGRSDNQPRKLNSRMGKSGTVTLMALPDQTVPFSRSYRGFRLRLINDTSSEVAFSASDSRLPILQEALDTRGRWRPIEYLPETWCGNSYHSVYLPARHYFEFAVPIYSGRQRTRLRFVLQREQGGSPIYSNEFEGSINPRQFSKKQGHRPTGLMDPYDE